MQMVLPIRGEEINRYLKILNNASGAKMTLLAFLGLRTGLRVSDLLKLKYGQFKPSKEYLEVRQQKTKKKKQISIDDEMRQAVMRLKKFTFSNSNDFLFSGQDPSKPMHRSTVYRHMRKAGELCGLEKVGTHSLRKSYAVQLYIDSGGDIDLVQKSLNHKYTETTLYSYILSGVNLKELLKNQIK